MRTIFFAIAFLLIIQFGFGCEQQASNCDECLNIDNCGWCAKTSQCQNGTASGPVSLASPCANGTCWAFGPNATCPLTCKSIDVCSECTATPGCAWCGLTHQCTYILNNNANGRTDIALPCDGSDCGYENEASCWKFKNSYHDFVGNCPTVSSCSSISNCRQCTENDCFWCGTSETCMEAVASGIINPCNGTCERGASNCFFGKTDDCPNNYSRCSDLTDCQSCASAGCGFCIEDGKCHDTCAVSCTMSGNECLVEGEICPGVVGNTTYACSTFNNNCTACLDAHCGYCSETGQCLTANGYYQCQNVACNDFLNYRQAATCPSGKATTSSTTSSSNNSDDDTRKKIIGGVVGSIIILGVVSVVAFFVVRQVRKRKYHSLK